MIVSPDCDTTHSAGDTLSKIQLYEFLDHPSYKNVGSCLQVTYSDLSLNKYFEWNAQ